MSANMNVIDEGDVPAGMKSLVYIGLAIGLGLPVTSIAYDPQTHALIAGAALSNSRLAESTSLYDDLGIRNTVNKPLNQCVEENGPCYPNPQPFGISYYDFSDSEVRLRTAADANVEDVMMSTELGVSTFNVPGWVMRGAIREDDNPSEVEKSQDLDWPKFFHREFNHFYDPVNNVPLHVFGINAFYYVDANTTTLRKSVDWATGMNDSFSADQSKSSDTMNHFTVLSARESEWRALTGTSGKGGVITVDASPAKEVDRNRYWATMLRALGDVVHLNEDSAQPQHTRNEAHSGAGYFDVIKNAFTGQGSAYEQFIYAVTVGRPSIDVEGRTYTVPELAKLDLTPKFVPSFVHYSDFWSTNPGVGGSVGMGMTDFSNFNFFTPAHSFGEGTYANPPSVAALYGKSTNDVTTSLTNFSSVTRHYLTKAPVGNYSMDVDFPAVRMVTESVWTQFADVGVPTYSFDENVYLDEGGVLVPRAVGYSAGLLNYFFRGALEITPPAIGIYGIIDEYKEKNPSSDGFRKIRLRVKNTTPKDTPWGPQDMSGGSLTAVVKFHRNLCFSADLTGEWKPGKLNPNSSGDSDKYCRSSEEEIVTSNADEFGNKYINMNLPAGGDARELSFSFGQTPIPVSAIDVYLQVVYRGPLGAENDAVVVGTVDISEPTHTALVNTTSNYVCINGNWNALNSNGTVPDTVKKMLTDLHYSPDAADPMPYQLVRMAIQQHPNEPFYRMTDKYGPTLDYPILSQLVLNPSEYIRFATLTDPLVPHAWLFPPDFEYFDTEPYHGEANGIRYDPTPDFSHSDLTPLVGVNAYQGEFGYRYFGSTKCDTVPVPTDDLGADLAPFQAKTLVQAGLEPF